MKTTDNKQQTMEQLEEKLLSRFGTERPFTVPDGYFESLTDRVMSRIAQRKRRRLVWRWAAAAILVGCVATGGLLYENRQQTIVRRCPADTRGLGCRVVPMLCEAKPPY